MDFATFVRIWEIQLGIFGHAQFGLFSFNYSAMLGRIFRPRNIGINTTSWIPRESRRELFVFSDIVCCIENQHFWRENKLDYKLYPQNKVSCCYRGNLLLNFWRASWGKQKFGCWMIVQRALKENYRPMQQYKVERQFEGIPSKKQGPFSRPTVGINAFYMGTIPGVPTSELIQIRISTDHRNVNHTYFI